LIIAGRSSNEVNDPTFLNENDYNHTQVSQSNQDSQLPGHYNHLQKLFLLCEVGLEAYTNNLSAYRYT
jgi:hypothetical protein